MTGDSRPAARAALLAAAASLAVLGAIPTSDGDSPAAPATRRADGAPASGAAHPPGARFAGLALEVRGGRLVVAAVLAGSPAAAAGVMPGDALLVVNGRNLIDLDAISPAAGLDLLRRSPSGEARLLLGRGTGTLGVVLPLASRPGAPPPSAGEPPRAGDPAPDFSGRGLDGEEVSLASLRGTPVLIEFWASWCAPCRSSAITLRRLADAHAGRLAFVGVSLDEDPKSYEAFAVNHRLPGPQIFDGGWHGPVSRLYGVAGAGIPLSVLVDGAGRIAAIGPSLKEMEEVIDRLAGPRTDP